MHQFIKDLGSLVKNHWKIIAVILLVIWIVANYADIKAGFLEGYRSSRK
jgi:hypothetical protein